MKASLERMNRLLNKRSRSGQSIILVAFVFIALIAFVGIATDVAMLFVRYSTLRRAVDAAAIGAAGQVRENATYYTLNSIARQFVALHGIDANNVTVETCDTEVVQYLNLPGNGTKTTQQALDALTSATPPSELCKKNPQKLVRVTALLDSPTAFLHLFGWKNVTLQASAISQTAVLDVALVLDTSLSEATDTFNHEKATYSGGTYVYPCGTSQSDLTCSSSDNSTALQDFKDFTNNSPYVSSDGVTVHLPCPGAGCDSNITAPWGLGLDPANASAIDARHTNYRSSSAVPIRNECWAMPAPDDGGQRTTRANYAWAGCCNDPTTQTDDTAGNTNFNLNTGDFNPDPNWYLFDSGDNTLAESVVMISGYNPYIKNPANLSQQKPSAKVVSNAPDGNYSDLICRPFKDVRDAARRFIKSLDFVRGDRVFLVTFDSAAKLIYPYGNKTETPSNVGKSGVAAITDKGVAIRTLNMQVGVEVNPSNLQAPCQSIPQYTQQPGYGWNNVNPRSVLSYWTAAQCPDTNTGGGILAATSAIVNPDWIRRDSVWVMVILSDGYPNRTPSVGTFGIGNTERNWLQTASSVSGSESMPDYTNPSADLVAKYCWPYQTSDGTAAGTYPKLDASNNPVPNTYYNTKPQWCSTSLTVATNPNNHAESNAWGLAHDDSGNYNTKGSFGFCPWWTFCDLSPDYSDLTNGKHTILSSYQRLTECTENNPRATWEGTSKQQPTTWPESLNKTVGAAPACTDTDPDSRHFCMDGLGRINPSSADNPTPGAYYCDPHYDADDYARDRVDFAALINYMDRGQDGKPVKGNFIAMYSIYFAHNTSATIDDNILGIKFLRYVADAGDNGIIDNHLQRWYRDVRDGVAPAGNPANAWVRPPMGLNEGVTSNDTTTFPSFTFQTARNVQINPSSAQTLNPSCTSLPCTVSGGPDYTYGQTNKYTAFQLTGGGTQPVPPTYDGSDPIWVSALKYPVAEDPCAPYDYDELKPGPIPDPPSINTAYENAAKTDCGQFFFADSTAKMNKAFTEIAGRLFTRLSR